ncbi:MAG: PQQ-dependent sugar dehydrogenase [Phycisphaerae bacterium]
MQLRRGMMTAGLLALATTGIGASVASAQNMNAVAVVNTGLLRPIYLTHAPGDYSRLYVIEKRGVIRVILNGVLQTTPFLDVDALVQGGGNDFDERGLLGLAFHPDFANNRKFYINYTAVVGTGDTVVAEYTANDADTANPASANVIMTFDQPQTNHNGGWIGFGPDRFLYIGTGDGGNFNDQGAGHTEPNGNGLDTTTNLLGKMLRIDVDSDAFPADNNRDYAIPVGNPFVGVAGDDEIWAFGLRNPWRNAFDRETGDLYIADVGQDAWEEVNVQPAAAPGGRNYGWRCREGLVATGYPNTTCTGWTFTNPVQVYSHSIGVSITGGYVYRGCAIPALDGLYFYADYVSARVWTFRWNGGTGITNLTERTADLDPPAANITSIASFGEDAYGEIYIVSQVGTIWKIVAETVTGDCNADAVTDACQILDGSLADTDGDGRPDVCECVGDINNDNTTNLTDLAILLAAFGSNLGDPAFNAAADLNDDDSVGLSDLAILLGAFGCQ